MLCHLRYKIIPTFIKLLRKNVHFIMNLTETFSVIGSFILSIFIIKGLFYPDINISYYYLILGLTMLISWLILLKVTTLAILPRTQRYRTLFFRFAQVTFIEFLIASIIWALIASRQVPFILIPIYCSLSFAFTFVVRAIFYSIFKTYRTKGYNRHYVVVIADSFSDSILESLIKQTEWGFWIKYILSNSKLIRAKYGDQVKILKENTDINQLLDCNVIDEVIYCKNSVDDNQIRQIRRACDEIGVVFRLQSGLSPLEPFNLELETVSKAPYLGLVDVPANHTAMFIKTVSDLYFSFMIMLCLSPFLLLIALIIKIDSPGPVLFIQERIGLRGRKFKLYKFRTMITNAEQLLKNLKDKNEVDGPVFKIKRDPRVTRFGRFLRKTGIDEIPQLINVLKGEMSLIGPRPPVEEEVRQYERWQLRRLSVKPGITCTWQVIPNRNDINFEKWMKLDLQYIDNWSIFEDFKLFFRTIVAIFLATGH